MTVTRKVLKSETAQNLSIESNVILSSFGNSGLKY